MLITQLKHELSNDRADTQIENDHREAPTNCSGVGFEQLADRIAQRIWEYFEERLQASRSTGVFRGVLIPKYSVFAIKL